jgi:hypothetical protein
MEIPMTNASTDDKPTPTGVESQVAALFTDAFNPAAWMGQHTKMAEACAAAGQKYLEGLQEIASQTILLQSALTQQMVKSALSLTQASGAGHSTDEGLRTAASAMESTVESIRNVMTAACRCHTDTLGAFQERLSVNGHAKASASGRHHRPR